jgi:SP family sugar:H+ symporter-like MFS transporter
MVGKDKGNLGARVFFIWGSLCATCFVYAYFLIPETKGLTLEQVDRMMEESTPRTSAKWKPTTTFAAEMGIQDGHLKSEIVEDVERKGSIH